MSNSIKTPFNSRTYAGLLCVVLSMVVQWLGWEITDPEVQTIAEAVLGIGGVVLAAYGRNRATQPISMPIKMPNVLPMLLILLTPLFLTACGAKHTGPELARGSAAVLLSTYQGLHESYVEQYPTLSADEQSRLQTTAAPALNRAKRLVAAYGRAAALYSRVADYRAAVQAALDTGNPPPTLTDYVPGEVVQALLASLARLGIEVAIWPESSAEQLALLSRLSAQMYEQAVTLMATIQSALNNNGDAS